MYYPALYSVLALIKKLQKKPRKFSNSSELSTFENLVQKYFMSYVEQWIEKICGGMYGFRWEVANTKLVAITVIILYTSLFNFHTCYIRWSRTFSSLEKRKPRKCTNIVAVILKILFFRVSNVSPPNSLCELDRIQNTFYTFMKFNTDTSRVKFQHYLIFFSLLKQLYRKQDKRTTKTMYFLV